MAERGGRWYQRAGQVTGMSTIVLALSCQSPSEITCTREPRPSIQVTVRDGRTNAAPPDAWTAVVTARMGAYIDTLSFAGYPDFDPSRGAVFANHSERVGTYEVRVALPGYQLWQQSAVQVLDGGCRVRPAILEVHLEQ